MHETSPDHAPDPPRERMTLARAARLLSLLLAGASLVPAPVCGQEDTVSVGELGRLLGGEGDYATPGLRAFVAEAAEATRTLPELLESYQARVESEISIIQAEASGREVVLQIEQVASDVLWRRDRELVQQVVGYRSRTVGLIPSVLSTFDVPWIVPTLYGDRIDLVRWSAPTTNEEGRVLRRRALHPLGPERNRVYRFTGGDTVLSLRLPDRTVRLVRVEVTPVRLPEQPTLLFEGWMDIDADRHQIVRMRGRMIPSDPDPSATERILGAAFAGTTYVEFESAEYDGRFWLPRYQRIEVQAISRLIETRVALRLVSRFGHPDLDDPGPLAARYPDPPPGGLLVVGNVVQSDDFDDWSTGLGELTREVNARDFLDLEPEGGVQAAGPRVRLGVRDLSHLFRVNEAEGVFTGLGVTVYPGRAWREGRLRAHAGWAWREETLRGGVEIAHVAEEARWEWILRAERQIRTAGDFGAGYGREPGVSPMIAGDGELLYDHRTAGLVARQPRDAGWAWRLEAGRGEDRNVTYEEPPAPEGIPLPEVSEGGYWLGRATLERNPGVLGFGVIPGTALRLDVEGAAGELEWLRVQAGVGGRWISGDLSLEGRLDGGATVSDDPPPQRLFELGRYSGLPGYPVRAFAGDRVALAQAAVSYTLPILRGPLGVGGLYLPAVAPAPTVGVRAGWTEASERAEPVLAAMGTGTTDGIRSVLELRLRLFGGGVSVGAARPLDSDGRWRFVWSLAREF